MVQGYGEEKRGGGEETGGRLKSKPRGRGVEGDWEGWLCNRI